MKYHSIDIQWGNHDIIWMGAASGSKACIFNVLRICARYNNLDILEDGYGINIRPLTEFAMEEYSEQKGDIFKPQNYEKIERKSDVDLLTKIQKAVAIIQFKLEAEVIKRNPDFNMEDRLLLDKIDYENYEIEINGKKYKLQDTYFPTIDPKDPFKLTEKEQIVISKIVKGFENSEKLQSHIKFLYAKGNIYKIYNENLLIHGCIPMDENGNFIESTIKGKKLKGKKYLDYIERIARQGYFADKGSKDKKYGEDFLWYLWCGKNSPIFCKNAMKTFERYFIDDKKLGEEIKNPFYNFSEDENYCIKVLEEFGINKENGHIICGHMPVKLKKGESPIKANGKLLIIDGGLSKSYQKTTGSAGYTLIYSSYGLTLAEHEPFTSTENAIIQETDLHSSKRIVEKVERKRINNTDIGIELRRQIKDLEQLLDAYKSGVLK